MCKMRRHQNRRRQPFSTPLSLLSACSAHRGQEIRPCWAGCFVDSTVFRNPRALYGCSLPSSVRRCCRSRRSYSRLKDLGAKRFHGNFVVLVDWHTANAAEMIVAFVRENELATIVGEPTAGRLLSAISVKVGEGCHGRHLQFGGARHPCFGQ